MSNCRFAILLLLLWISKPLSGQEMTFSNISTSNGLSDNFIRALAIDRTGFLWVGTNEGLNVYDGYHITSFHTDDHPGIPSKTVLHLVADRDNNVWMGSLKGAGWVDPRRNFHRVILYDTLREFRCGSILETKTYGPVLFTEKGQFFSDKSKKKWSRIDWIPASLTYDSLADLNKFDDDRILIVTRAAVQLLDYSTKKIAWQYPIRSALSACHVKDNIIALADSKGRVKLIDITTNAVIKEYDLISYVQQGTPRTTWGEVRMAAEETILYSSNTMGFFMISKEGRIKRFQHQPTNPLSIAADKTMRLLGMPNGDVIVGTERYGLSICNILKKQAGYQKLFRDENGNYFDGFLTEMVRDKDGSYWLGAVDRLIRWDRHTNLSTFYYYGGPNPEFGIKNSEVHRICIDKKDQVWVSLLGVGPAYFDRRTGRFHLLERDTAKYPSLKSNFIYSIFQDSRDRIWVSSRTGFYFINPYSHQLEVPTNDPVLKDLSTKRTHDFAEDSKKRVWFSTMYDGIYCYDRANNTIRQFTKSDGLLDNNTGDLMIDSKDNLYITMYNGFNVIRSDGKIESYTRKNGLRFDKVDAFLEDDDGFIWISNAKCLVKFDPQTKKMEIFDEHENLNNGGFKPASSLKTPDGELLWGTQSGLNFFYPKQLSVSAEPLQVKIYQVRAGDSLLDLSGKNPARIKFRHNDLQFHFVAINLRGSHNIRYQYQLAGYDTKWQEGTDIRQASYLSLPPGDYSFRLRASVHSDNWVESSNSYSFKVIAPLHMRWWFKTIAALLVTGLLLFIFQRRGRLLRRKEEELETEKAINYFASSMYSHQTVDEIIWDVARNCIGRLQFEDCVIYLLDPEKNVLVQKAAYGPKSPRSFEITQPIDIPVGKGIVGSVAASGKAEIIPDTSKDPRYIVDDEVRLSEISVPIITDGRVLGVIDCEHSKKRFFTQKHLSILTTIASLCANKIVRARTEEAKKHTESMLAETKQKMAEAEMQALRAQMNPHFIFNCLNSINRYIVKSDQATASLYLTRFAKLIRLILDNSNSKNILLSNEIEALRLYIEMESLRFDHKFTYTITIDDAVNPDSIELPPLIIQPYIENAIWHGLLHKPGGGNLSLHIRLASPNMLECIIEDNGVGREKAGELKSKSVTKKKSLGMELTENRLLLLNQYAAVRSSVEIIDLKNEDEAIGTKVILKIPFGE